MSNPAFIVDGHTEQCFIQTICPGRPIQRTNLNGNKVSIEAISKKVGSMIRLLGNRYYPIIVLVDREDRDKSVEELGNELLTLLNQQGLDDQDIRIGFADRMIENWIIADFKLIDDLAKKPNETDGLNGASIIRKHLGKYSKVIDGVDLLQRVDKTIVYHCSPSYRGFIDRLKDITCDYINFDK